MTHDEFILRLEEMFSANNFLDDLQKEAQRLAKSGGVDLNKFDNDYELPKICLSLAFNKLSNELMPFSLKGRKVYKNLKHF